MPSSFEDITHATRGCFREAVCFGIVSFQHKRKTSIQPVVGISSLIFSSDVRQAKELRGSSLRFVKYVTHAMRRCFLEGCLFLFLGSSVQRCGDSILDIFKQCQRTWAKELRPSLRLNTLWNLDRSLNKRQAPSAQTIKGEWTAETSEAKHDECNAKKRSNTTQLSTESDGRKCRQVLPAQIA